MTRKKRVWLVVIAGAVLVGVLAVVLRTSSEPSYRGRKLSEWVESYATPPHMRQKGEAADAIRHIGTNAIPYLLKWIKYDPPSWKNKLYKAFNSTFERVNRDWVLQDERRDRADRATMAFRVLGSEAEGAIPELTRRMNDPKANRSAARAVEVLADLRNAGLPPLLAAITNKQWVAEYVVHRLGLMGTNAGSAIPSLQHLLTDPEMRMRQVATNALRKIDPTALVSNGAR